MLTAVDPNDLDHCARGCGATLPYFTRTIAYQRGEPQACWSCERKAVPPQEAMHRRIAARAPTVMRLHSDASADGPAA